MKEGVAIACYGYLGGGTVEAVKMGFTTGAALLKFSAKWCGPCKAVHPRFLEMIQQSSIPCYHVDIEDDPHDLSKAFSVTKLPTFLLLQDGDEVGRVEGANLERVAELLVPRHTLAA